MAAPSPGSPTVRTRPTDRPDWGVRQLACHVVAMAEMAAGIREGAASASSRARAGAEVDGYLIDTIMTRDSWMHRIDVARATGAGLLLTADHDGHIVGDVVAEWAGRHGAPYQLT